MRKDAFIDYLRKEPIGYAKTTARERAGFCSTIEDTFRVNLDHMSDLRQREDLLKKTAGMKTGKANLRAKALAQYFDFSDGDPVYYVPMGGHFYRLSNDMPPAVYFDRLPALKSEYESIMGWGRDLLSLDWQLLQGRLERIPVILSPAVKKKTYPADEHYWSRKIAELVREKKGDVTEKEILRILKQKTFSDRITGEFLAGHDQFGPHIILYYNVIGGETDEEMLAGFANVLAHEYMHYMEYRYCSAMGVADYTNQPLSEGMADFFGALYSIRRNCAESRKIAHARYKTWVKRFGSRWPYAHALYFYTIGSDRMGFSPNYADYERHGSLQKLKTIFHHCDQPKLAYDILINT